MVSIPASLEKYGDIIAAGQELLLAKRKAAGIEPRPAVAPPVQPSLLPEIPENLKKYQPEILAGLHAVDARRREITSAWCDDRRHVGLPQILNEPQVIERLDIPDSPPIQQPGPDLDQAKILPLLGLAAFRANAGGAWRVWTLSKALDRLTGSGVVSVCVLEDESRRLGVQSRTFARWLKDADRRGWMKQIIRRDGIKVCTLASPAIVAQSLRCPYVGGAWVNIGLSGLYKKSWESTVWAAFLSTIEGAISREKLRLITGIPESTQRFMEKTLPLDYEHNFAVSNRPADHVDGVRNELSRKAAFVFQDRRTKVARVAWRLPDKRRVPIYVAAPSGVSGRISKINGRLALSAGLSNTVCEAAPGSSPDRGSRELDFSTAGRALGVSTGRLFYDDHKAAEKAVRGILRRRAGKYTRKIEVHELYAYQRKGKGCRIYGVLSA